MKPSLRVALFIGLCLCLCSILLALIRMFRASRDEDRIIDAAVHDAANIYYPGQMNLIVWTTARRIDTVSPFHGIAKEHFQVQFFRTGSSGRDIIDLDYYPHRIWWKSRAPGNRIAAMWTPNMKGDRSPTPALAQVIRTIPSP
jgi:hypothetical protein